MYIPESYHQRAIDWKCVWLYIITSGIFQWASAAHFFKLLHYVILTVPWLMSCAENATLQSKCCKDKFFQSADHWDRDWVYKGWRPYAVWYADRRIVRGENMVRESLFGGPEAKARQRVVSQRLKRCIFAVSLHRPTCILVLDGRRTHAQHMQSQLQN